MAPPTPDDIVLLEMTICGRVIIPANKLDYDYQVHKIHNAGFRNRKPLLFILCHNAGDVVEAIKFVTKHELPLSIRSGGHSACGSSLKENSVVIDLANMRSVSYDAATEEVTVEPGATLSDLNVELMRNDRMTPVGVAPPTGCGGLVLHGGIGYLSGRFGTSVDNVTSLALILADGTMKHLDFDSEGDDKELFFAARGAAGSLGICTRFTMRTYPMEILTGGFWMMQDDEDYTHSRKILKLARDTVLAQEASGHRTLTGTAFMGNFPPEEAIPAELHGKPCTIVAAGVWGTDESAKELIAQFCDRPVIFGKPPAPMPFPIFNQILAGMFLNFPPLAGYFKGVLVHDYPDEKIDEFADIWKTHEPFLGNSMVGLDFYGGKAGTEHGAAITKDNDHCISNLRNFTFGIPCLTYYPNEPQCDEAGRAMSRKLADCVGELSTAFYMNYFSDLGEADEKKKLVSLMMSNQERLAAVKKNVDPQNVFDRSVISIAKH